MPRINIGGREIRLPYTNQVRNVGSILAQLGAVHHRGVADLPQSITALFGSRPQRYRGATVQGQPQPTASRLKASRIGRNVAQNIRTGIEQRFESPTTFQRSLSYPAEIPTYEESQRTPEMQRQIRERLQRGLQGPNAGQVLGSSIAAPYAYPRNPLSQAQPTVFPRSAADVGRNVRDLPASILSLFSPLVGSRRYGMPIQQRRSSMRSPQAQASTPSVRERYMDVPNMGPTQQEIEEQQRRQMMLNMMFGR